MVMTKFSIFLQALFTVLTKVLFCAKGNVTQSVIEYLCKKQKVEFIFFVFYAYFCKNNLIFIQKGVDKSDLRVYNGLKFIWCGI